MKIPKSNLHTHTCFCDGKDTPAELVEKAIGEGMEVLGFSGHAYMPFDLDCCMMPDETEEYRREVLRLKQTCGDRLGILLGIEQDLFAEGDPTGYDYVIGSVHYMLLDGEYYAVDLSPEQTNEIVRRYFGGDVYRYLRHYYEMMAQMASKVPLDIVGHFDLISKFNEGGCLFDESDPRYLRYAIDALDALLEKDLVFEINTGAISRGYRRTPYPSPIFLHRIAEKRGRVTFNSDAHRKENLLFGYADALHIARAAGLGALTVMTRDGWREFSLSERSTCL